MELGVKSESEVRVWRMCGIYNGEFFYLIFGRGTGAGDPATRPDRGGRVGSSQLHGDHSVLTTKLHVHAVQCDFTQIQVASHAKRTHHVVDDDIDFGLRLWFDIVGGRRVGGIKGR